MMSLQDEIQDRVFGAIQGENDVEDAIEAATDIIALVRERLLSAAAVNMHINADHFAYQAKLGDAEVAKAAITAALDAALGADHE